MLDLEPRRRRHSAERLGSTRKHRRRKHRRRVGWLAVILVLVSLFGVGYSFPPGQETIRSVTQPSLYSEIPSRLSAAEGPAVRSNEDLLREEAKEKLLA